MRGAQGWTITEAVCEKGGAESRPRDSARGPGVFRLRALTLSAPSAGTIYLGPITFATGGSSPIPAGSDSCTFRWSSTALASVAGLAAHVKLHVGGASMAQQMATAKSSGAGARVSGLRFRRLLAVSDRNELYPLLLRVVRLLDGHVNLVSLANAAFWWNERTRQEWAYDYYATAPSEV